MAQPEIIIRRVQTIEEYQTCQRIHRQVWGFGPEDTVMHLPLMVALQEYGGLVLGAFAADAATRAESQVGFALGFTGRDEMSGRYFHYSQIAAALTEWQSRGVGFALKTAQRREVLGQGYRLMRWAYDPLEARNAYFNLVKLGGVARRYLPNMYGTGKGELFGQLDTDRLIVDWELDSSRVAERLAQAERGQKPLPARSDYEAAPALVGIAWRGDGIPVVTSTELGRDEPQLKLEIPYHNLQVQKYSFQAGVEWREQTRALFSHYLAAGYYAADFFTIVGEYGPRAFYLLQKDIVNDDHE